MSLGMARNHPVNTIQSVNDPELAHVAFPTRSHGTCRRTFTSPVRAIQEEPEERDQELIPIIWDFETLKKEQAADTYVQRCKLQEGFYEAPSGIVYKQRTIDEREDKVVVPQKSVPEILFLYHATPVACHQGNSKTLQNIRKSFYWPHMARDVKEFVQKCHSCSIHKTHPQQPAELVIADIPAEVFGKVSMDIVGPLNVTSKGNKYILTFIDYLTRWAETIAIPDMKTTTIAKAFVETIILRHGVPHILLTDRGVQFISGLFQEVCKLLGIKKIFTSPYRPNTNGVIERLHKSLKQMISHFVSEDKANWDEFLPYATMAYRNSVHDSTSETPFYLLYGRDMRLPTYIPTERDRVRYDLDDNYCSELKMRLHKARRIAHENLQKKAHEQSERFNRKANTRQLQVGDLVYMKAEIKLYSNLASSFQPKWSGPFRIIEIKSPVNYKIRNLSTGKESNIHINRLKLCRGSGKPYSKETHKLKLASKNNQSLDPSKEIYYPNTSLQQPPATQRQAPTRPYVDSDSDTDSEITVYNNPIFRLSEVDDDDDIDEVCDESEEELVQELDPQNSDLENVEPENAHQHHTRSRGPAEDHPWVLRKKI